MILFYVEFDNGDSNCYQGTRAPTLEEARAFCKDHIESNEDWNDVVFVSGIDRAQAEKFWDIPAILADKNWPSFLPEAKERAASDRPFAYVCSPFHGDTEANAERAREYCRTVFDSGYAPIAPHLYFSQFLQDNKQAEREAGMEMGAALLPLCRVLVICGNDITEGMKREIQQAQRLDIEVCALENIDPIPTYNFRDDISGLDKMEIAASLIEGMTGCRFTTGFDGVFICPDSESYLAVNMRGNSLDFKAELYHIGFDANIRTMGRPMSADELLKLQQETERVHALLSILEAREYVLTPEERTAFIDSIRQREEQEQGQDTESAKAAAHDQGGNDVPTRNGEKPSVLRKIAESREKAASKPKRDKSIPDKPRRSRREEEL